MKEHLPCQFSTSQDQVSNVFTTTCVSHNKQIRAIQWSDVQVWMIEHLHDQIQHHDRNRDTRLMLTIAGLLCLGVALLMIWH